VSYFVDVGSTVLKVLSIKPDGSMGNTFHFYNDSTLYLQVVTVLASMGWNMDADDLRICSSHNGGLSVGLVALSRRVSGAIAKNFLEGVGANVRFVHEWHTAAQDQSTAEVDVLVVVGGIDEYPEDRAKSAIEVLCLKNYQYGKLVYSGHKSLAKSFCLRWPEAEHVENLLSTGVAPNNHALPFFIRDTYLKDIESKRHIAQLQKLSSAQIMPTPSVVSLAFSRMQDRFLSPALVFDVGGATTDVHFPRELLDEKKLPISRGIHPPISRHVFTAYGVYESRASTLSCLVNDAQCVQLLINLDKENYRHLYADLMEGIVSNRVLFSGCIFLAFRDMISGNDLAPILQMGRISTIGITGGAAKEISAQEVSAAYNAAVGHHMSAQVVFDKKYRWWGMGMLDSTSAVDRYWEKCNE